MVFSQPIQGSLIYWWPECGKLIFLKEKATPEYWDQHWQTDDWKKKITRSRKSRFWRGILKKYLPDKNSKVLEGGCGYGHIVDAMDYWGYHAFGVDFAKETVAKVNETMPNLNVTYGDIRKLNFEDGFFDGYWLLGVIEHFWDGYHDILQEMRRVLKVGGYAFVAFPCISRIDRLKIILSKYKKFTGHNMPSNFYQFGLSVKTVKKDLEQANFRCLKISRGNGLQGLERVWPASSRLHRILLKASEKNRFIKLLTTALNAAMAPLCGHSVLIVSQKR